jgi:hypothetical protein
MSVKKLNFHHMSHLRFPSRASKSTKEWTEYYDEVDISSLVLMENMEREGAENIFIAFKDLNDIFSDDISSASKKADKKAILINSKIALVSMRTEHQPLLPEPISVTFEHLNKENASNSPKCAHWDATRHDWSTSKCRLDWTNATHSECQCYTFGLFALLEEFDLAAMNGAQGGLHVTVVVSIIVVTVVVFASL